MKTIWSKDDLVAVVRERRSALGLSQLALDHEAGLPDGYTGKLEASAGKANSRSIGWESLPKILGALGIEIAVNQAMHSTCEHDDETLAGKEIQTKTAIVLKKKLSARGRRGALAGHARRTDVQRTRKARKAALARWAKAGKRK